MIAALYVERGGVYYGLPDVDPWDEERDARLYAGPWPVVAHPVCARWSRLAALVESRGGATRRRWRVLCGRAVCCAAMGRRVGASRRIGSMAGLRPSTATARGVAADVLRRLDLLSGSGPIRASCPETHVALLRRRRGAPFACMGQRDRGVRGRDNGPARAHQDTDGLP
jgi:hypothetical protein